MHSSRKGKQTVRNYLSPNRYGEEFDVLYNYIITQLGSLDKDTSDAMLRNVNNTIRSLQSSRTLLTMYSAIRILANQKETLDFFIDNGYESYKLACDYRDMRSYFNNEYFILRRFETINDNLIVSVRFSIDRVRGKYGRRRNFNEDYVENHESDDEVAYDEGAEKKE